MTRLFAESKWTLGVVGLGYVGLPLLISATRAGLGAVGFDVSPQVVEALGKGVSHIDDVSGSDLVEAVEVGGATFTTEVSELGSADAIFICVPSPLGRNREPDLSYIEASARAIAEVARPGQLIVLESTTYPGTTEDYIVPAVEKAGLHLDEDVWVAYSPERVSPGDELKTSQIPKVVGGVTAASGEIAAAAYRRLVPSVHLVSSARVAEMSKLLENTYRAVNIGLINEVTQLSHELDIDVWEVIDAAATKPFGFQAFYPGPGVGGHCIPLDPQYLAWSGRAANFATRFIETAEQINTQMPTYVMQRATDVLNGAGKSVQGSRILALGIAYKADISDDRESASLRVARLLQDRGAEVFVLDPHISPERIEEHGFQVHDGTDVSPESGYDLAVVLTDHSGVPYEEIARSVGSVFDTRGVYRRLGLDLPNVQLL
jgi:UDP-N-acetyl-D-glucosamine dehydrogenase